MLFVDPITGAINVYEYSTVKSVQDSCQNFIASPVVKSFGQDFNRDGKPE